MQPQDGLSVSRRALDIEDYIDIARRHKAWIFGPAFAALVIAVVVAFLWPDTYLSSAVIRVVPPQVPETYFPPNITTDMQGRINSLTQMILNRANLTALVNKYQLYKKELTRMPMEDVIENMKTKDIRITTVSTFAQAMQGSRQAVPAFMIGFQYSNRFTAQKVTEDLVASFMTESQSDIQGQGQGTTDLLQTQWESAKAKLDECDSRLQAFREKHLGSTPDQRDSSYSQLNSLQSQMINLESQMNRTQQEKLGLENEMRIAKTALSQLKDPNTDQQAIEMRDEKLAQKDREIEQNETYLARLKERYKETHPDVQQAEQQINLLKRQREEIKKEDATKKPAEPRVLPPNPQFVRDQHALQVQMQRIQSAQEAKDMEMANLQKEEAQITQSLKIVQSRIEATPLSEKEYTELLSDRDLALKNYQDADMKLSLSKKAQDVTRRQQGEKLAILDPASAPQTPTEPKRPIIVAIGAGMGLALGVMLAGVREMKNTSLKNLKDVRAYTQLPVLGSIPLLENDLVVRRRRRLGWLAWSTACLVGLVIMSSSVAYYYSTKM